MFVILWCEVAVVLYIHIDRLIHFSLKKNVNINKQAAEAWLYSVRKCLFSVSVKRKQCHHIVFTNDVIKLDKSIVHVHSEYDLPSKRGYMKM